MKNSFVLALVLFVLGIVFAYMAVITEQKQVYYKHFIYSTDDYEDEYEGMFVVNITDEILSIEDSIDHPLIFNKLKDGRYQRDGYPQVYELIVTNYSVTLQEIDTDDTNSKETLYLTGMTRY